MNSYQQLLQSIDDIKASGKKVKVTVLPSAIRKKQKSLLWLLKTVWPGDVIKLTTFHTN